MVNNDEQTLEHEAFLYISAFEETDNKQVKKSDKER